MKSKKLLRTLAALCTALVLMGGFSVPAYAGGGEPADETNDSNVQVEQPEETPPLTPDGNASLVDDYGGNKQLITVTTKNGNYFYILVDRDDEGENTVHFLNQVDEADLMALMEDGDSEEPPAVCSCTEKCQAGAINRNYQLMQVDKKRVILVCRILINDLVGKLYRYDYRFGYDLMLTEDNSIEEKLRTSMWEEWEDEDYAPCDC